MKVLLLTCNQYWQALFIKSKKMEKLIEFKKDWLEKEMVDFVALNTPSIKSLDLTEQIIKAIKLSAPWREKSYLAINIAKDFGLKAEYILPLLITTEFLMIAALTADDVFDSSTEREGEQSLLAIKGINSTFQISENIYSLAILSLNNFFVINKDVPELIKEKIVNSFLKSYQGIQVAQYWRQNQNIESVERMSVSEILNVYDLAVGALFAATLAFPAYLIADFVKAETLENIGRNMGTALQVSNDISDFSWEEKDLGRKGLEDLKQGQPSVALNIFLKKAAELKYEKKIKQFLTLEDNHEEIRQLSEESGAISESRKVLTRLISEIKKDLEIFEENTEEVIKHILELLIK